MTMRTGSQRDRKSAAVQPARRSATFQPARRSATFQPARRSATFQVALRPGFTMIEIMLSLAVLAFSLATLIGWQAAIVRDLRLADELHLSSLLIRTQMGAVEQMLERDGYQTTILTERGDFGDQGHDDYEWEAIIEPVEITTDAEDMFVANIHAELFGEGTTGEGSLSGAAAVSQFLPLIIAQVPTFINQVGERTRKITLTVMWEGVMGPMTLTATQYYTVLELQEAQPLTLQEGAGLLGEGAFTPEEPEDDDGDDE